MRHRAIQSNLSFTFPTDAKTDQEFTSSKQAKQTATGDVPDPIIVSNDPPLKFLSEETPKPPDEEQYEDVMFDDDRTSVGAIPILTTFKSLEKPSSSKPAYDFNLFSSPSKEEELNLDANTPRNQGNETETNPIDNPTPSKLQDDDVGDYNDKQSASSTSDTISSNENIVDCFSWLEQRDNVVSVISKDTTIRTISNLRIITATSYPNENANSM
ncbi:unnamed protein product [Lactuca saligna]|uniref:Uncharacterized protein n=1 Tax=Lactuca saligna TaxID=75948 RepID=A0AA35ZIM0_LACSI|nr:unnamed protein product [Lactuca saligna]